MTPSLVWPPSVRRWRPSLAFHRRMVNITEPEAMVSPSGENATDYKPCVALQRAQEAAITRVPQADGYRQQRPRRWFGRRGKCD